MIPILAGIAAALAGIGLVEALVASRLVAAHARRSHAPPVARPPVTVLKPLHGDEPMLGEALATLCRQDYPNFQIVFGVQDAADPAIAVVRRLQERFPHVHITLAIDPTPHGRNRKVSNLINMITAARHDVLVIADADVHVRPDYLVQLVAALQKPGVGLVTVLYAGLPAIGANHTQLPPHGASVSFALPRRLGSTKITHGFLPGAVLARTLGRQDCLGATMCLQRHVLERIGGFPALVDHLADDNVLGRRITALGLSVALADTIVLTTVPETSLRALFRHELRWARTIRALEPAGFAASALQYPSAWSLLTMLLTGGALWSIGLFLAVWVLRAAAGLGIDHALAPLWTERSETAEPEIEERNRHDVGALAFACPVWLLPLRDILSVAVMLASYGGRQVEWRGHILAADRPPLSSGQRATRLLPNSGHSRGSNAR